MKKILFLFCAGVLLSGLCATFEACDDHNKPPQKQEQEPNEEPEEPKEPEEREGIVVPFSEYSLDRESFIWPSVEESLSPIIMDSIRIGEHVTLAIDSDEELRNFFEGDYPPIDFSKYTLLLVAVHTGQGIHKIEIDDLREVLPGKYALWANLFMMDTMLPARRLVAILVDKLADDSVVELIIVNGWELNK